MIQTWSASNYLMRSARQNGLSSSSSPFWCEARAQSSTFAIEILTQKNTPKPMIATFPNVVQVTLNCFDSLSNGPKPLGFKLVEKPRKRELHLFKFGHLFRVKLAIENQLSEHDSLVQHRVIHIKYLRKMVHAAIIRYLKLVQCYRLNNRGNMKHVEA